MNKVMLIGRLTADPEIRYSQGENAIAVGKYTLAVDRRYKKDGEQTADFIRCVVFGKGAEFSGKYFFKGMKVAITGRIQTGSYLNKDNQRVYTTEVFVEEQEFAESKKTNDPGMQGARQQNPASGQSAGHAPDGFMDIPDDIGEELPFN